MPLIYPSSELAQVEIDGAGEENPNYPTPTAGFDYGATWYSVSSSFEEAGEAGVGLIAGPNSFKGSKYLYVEFQDIELTQYQFLVVNSVIVNKKAIKAFPPDPGSTTCYDLHARVMVFNNVDTKVFDSGDLKKTGYWPESYGDYTYLASTPMFHSTAAPYSAQFVIASALISGTTQSAGAYIKTIELDYIIGFIDPPDPTGVGIGFKPYMMTI